MIVVVCGKKRSGKTEAGYIIEKSGRGFGSYALGDHVKETLENAGRIKFDDKNPLGRLITDKTLREGDRDGGILLVNNQDVYQLMQESIALLQTKGFLPKTFNKIIYDALDGEMNRLIRENTQPWTARRLMQTFATDLVCLCIDDTTFVRMTFDRIMKNQEVGHVMITDCRQPHEYKYLRMFGAKFIFIDRDTGMQDSHYSEQGIQPMTGDIQINNNGTLRELKDAVLHAIYEIKR